MTPGAIMQEIENCKRVMTSAVTNLKTLGVKLANKESIYRRAVAKKEVYLRKVDKYPANLVYDIARGDEQIAPLRLERDIAKIDYEICKEGLKNIRAEIEALRSLLTWEREELKNT